MRVVGVGGEGIHKAVGGGEGGGKAGGVGGVETGRPSGCPQKMTTTGRRGGKTASRPRQYPVHVGTWLCVCVCVLVRGDILVHGYR